MPSILFFADTETSHKYTAGAEKSKFDINLPRLGSSRCSQDHNSWLSPTAPHPHASQGPQLRQHEITPARRRTNESGTSAGQCIVRPLPALNGTNVTCTAPRTPTSKHTRVHPVVCACKPTQRQNAMHLGAEAMSPPNRLGNVLQCESFWRQHEKPPHSTYKDHSKRLLTGWKSFLEKTGHPGC
ncbi:hypothetical protein PGT21_024710 [Puccinia graminis f. sp. tritici]|uniref:Uncharacterized protein n=1 Tax=Puccinia graminis f. sp. tritici TaxID=56615 RepID=A0A5B0QJ58_PUCGR|nr:hypothetical protein PGT21_024710 [Puccinia graminis f. sp. tritici]